MSLASTPKPPLRLIADGKRSFIKVPSAFAGDLVIYLRRSGHEVGPPSPSSDGIENVEIGGKVNAEDVQALLDRWAKSTGQAQQRPREHRADTRTSG
jgi:hypothetical protein